MKISMDELQDFFLQLVKPGRFWPEWIIILSKILNKIFPEGITVTKKAMYCVEN